MHRVASISRLVITPAILSPLAAACRPNLRRPLRRHQTRWYNEGGSHRRTTLKGRIKEQTPWEILGVTRDCSDADLKKAYRELAKKFHPDRTGGDDAKFKQVKEAFDLIKTGKAKTMYPEHPAGPEVEWAKGFAGFQGQQPINKENLRYSSQQTTWDTSGGRTTTYTFKDEHGHQYTFTEVHRNDYGAQDFWELFKQMQNRSMESEVRRMRDRAEQQQEYREIFMRWAQHKNMGSVDYAAYIRDRDTTLYKFLVLWVATFIVLRILLNIFV